MGEKPSRPLVPSPRMWWLVLGASLLLLYLVRSILPPFLIGIAAAYVLSPLVTHVQRRWRLPRAIAVLLLYLVLIGPLVVALIFFGPRFVVETRQLIVRSPVILGMLIEQAFGPGPFDLFGTVTTPRQIAFDLIGSVRESLGTPTTAIHVASAFAEFVLSAFLALIVSIYLLLDSERVGHFFIRLIPADRQIEVAAVSEEIHRTLGRYLLGELILIGIVSTASFLGLEFLFHLRYALPLAVATGFLEIIPFLGPVLAGSIAAALALLQGGPGLAVGIIVFYTVIRQVEDQIVMPVVVGRAVELHPILVIFAVLAGGALLGVLGTLLAVPVAASIKVMLDAWLPVLSPKETEIVPAAKRSEELTGS